MQMGFEEMPTNKWVESSFWNFDSLFQPQSHPARDAHDTFFIKEPASTVSVPEEYYERVKQMHEIGGSGSIGYRYDFKREGESCCHVDVLRTLPLFYVYIHIYTYVNICTCIYATHFLWIVHLYIHVSS